MSNKKAKLNGKLVNNKKIHKNPQIEEKIKLIENEKPKKDVKSIKKEKYSRKYKEQVIKNKNIIKKIKTDQKKEKKTINEKLIIEEKQKVKENTFAKIKAKSLYVPNLVITKIKKIRKKTRRLVIISLLVMLGAIITLVVFYNSPARISLIYDEYFIGDTVTLKDGSVWYVVDDSSNKNPNVRLLKEKPIDINNDGSIDNNDKLAFDKDGNIDYDKKSENNIAYYLNNEYKDKLTELGKIKSVDLLTSEEYINLRNALGCGYEWEEDNLLAGESIGYWWLETNRNKSVYTVNTKGSYVLYKPTRTSLVRPVITKDKKDIEAITTLIRKK